MSQTTPGLLIHNVFFTLKESTERNRRALVDACNRYLRQHEGIVFFACATLAEGLNREVNVRDFDIGLHIVFTDQAAHDRYQEHPLHIQFVEENKPTWRQVRVFDSVVPGSD